MEAKRLVHHYTQLSLLCFRVCSSHKDSVLGTNFIHEPSLRSTSLERRSLHQYGEPAAAIVSFKTASGIRYRNTITNRFVAAPSRKPLSQAAKLRHKKARASRGLCAKPVNSKIHCSTGAHVRKLRRGRRVVPCCASNPKRSKSSRKSSRKSARKSSRSIAARDGMCGSDLY